MLLVSVPLLACFYYCRNRCFTPSSIKIPTIFYLSAQPEDDALTVLSAICIINSLLQARCTTASTSIIPKFNACIIYRMKKSFDYNPRHAPLEGIAIDAGRGASLATLSRTV